REQSSTEEGLNVPPIVDALVVQRRACGLIRLKGRDQQSIGLVDGTGRPVWHMAAGCHLAPVANHKGVGFFPRIELLEPSLPRAVTMRVGSPAGHAMSACRLRSFKVTPSLPAVMPPRRGSVASCFRALPCARLSSSAAALAPT